MSINQTCKINRTKKSKKSKYEVRKLTEEQHIYFTNSKKKLEIKESNIKEAGLGVFALEDIFLKDNDGFLDFYEGNYVTTSSKLVSQDYYGINLKRLVYSLYFIEIENDIGIDASNYPRCYMAMINDCYKTKYEINTEFRNIPTQDGNPPKVGIWITRDIKKGEELFISYGENYWY